MTCTFGHSTKPKAPASTFPIPEKASNNGASSKKEQTQNSIKALAFLFPLKEAKKNG